jgi:hypothetical protein
VKLPTPRDRDEGLTLIAAAVHEARAVLQPWECDGLAALITQFAMTSPTVAEDRQRHGYIR